jgi:hypothetical protein
MISVRSWKAMLPEGKGFLKHAKDLFMRHRAPAHEPAIKLLAMEKPGARAAPSIFSLAAPPGAISF